MPTLYFSRDFDLLEIPREDEPKLPTWDSAQGLSTERSDIIQVAIGRADDRDLFTAILNHTDARR